MGGEFVVPVFVVETTTLRCGECAYGTQCERREEEFFYAHGDAGDKAHHSLRSGALDLGNRPSHCIPIAHTGPGCVLLHQWLAIQIDPIRRAGAVAHFTPDQHRRRYPGSAP